MPVTLPPIAAMFTASPAADWSDESESSPDCLATARCQGAEQDHAICRTVGDASQRGVALITHQTPTLTLGAAGQAAAGSAKRGGVSRPLRSFLAIGRL